MSKPMIQQKDAPELTGQIIDIFEDFLTAKHLAPGDNSPDNNNVFIQNSDYDSLNRQITDLLIQWKIIPEGDDT